MGYPNLLPMEIWCQVFRSAVDPSICLSLSFLQGMPTMA